MAGQTAEHWAARWDAPTAARLVETTGASMAVCSDVQRVERWVLLTAERWVWHWAVSTALRWVAHWDELMAALSDDSKAVDWGCPLAVQLDVHWVALLVFSTADLLVFLMVDSMECHLVERMGLSLVGTMVVLKEKMRVGHLVCQMAG